MIKDPTAACRQYATDNAAMEGIAVSFTTVADITAFALENTSETWEDGVPVTKMYTRNRPVDVCIPKDTLIRGVLYTGRTSGERLCEFIFGATWYRTYQVTEVEGEETVFGCKVVGI